MKIQAGEDYTLIVTEVYNGLLLKTEEGQELGVCMRDGAFEVSINGHWYTARDSTIVPWPIPKEPVDGPVTADCTEHPHD